MKNLSTRSKLILLVVVPALPVLALTLYSAFEERALNLAGIALVTILLVLGAWYGTEVFVLRNIRTLLDTARRELDPRGQSRGESPGSAAGFSTGPPVDDIPDASRSRFGADVQPPQCDVAVARATAM